MSKDLDKQIYIYSLDTSAFYTDEEYEIFKTFMELSRQKGELKKSRSESEENKKAYKKLIKEISTYKAKLTEEMNKNKTTRDLRSDSVKDSDIISIFDSVLTRTLKLKENTLSTDVIVVRSYYYRILKDLITDGFIFNNEKYIYYTSSAGQIRTKKSLFIKESVWETYKDTLTCGLSVDEINDKGGSNVNKYLSYLALSNSATVEWKGFNINKTIVVDDLATNVNSLVDYIDRDTYEITRQTMGIEIEHTDGCGMILPKKSKKSFMCRLPFVKGLLVPFDFKEFARIHNESYKVRDIYGKEWDIEKDEIEVIFTKSQFKMCKYYDGWDDYKKRFTKYNCKAAKLNEEDTSNGAMLNYQMLQTLTDITDEELTEICKSTVDDIINIGSDKETMLRVLGATESNKRKNYFQQALYMYPELLNDAHAKQTIKDKKKSLVRSARAGKLNVNGKYTFLCPDLYAFCERLFLGIKEPKGLLHNGEVFCRIFEEGKIDCLRSPHLYREHAIRNNILDDEKRKWFITDGIYTSVFDSVSKMLQFDK